MITKNKTKIQLVKELLEQEQITFEQSLILVEDSYEEIYNSENKFDCHNIDSNYNNNSGTPYNGYISHTTAFPFFKK
jgi:hypothetical protein